MERPAEQNERRPVLIVVVVRRPAGARHPSLGRPHVPCPWLPALPDCLAALRRGHNFREVTGIRNPDAENRPHAG